MKYKITDKIIKNNFYYKNNSKNFTDLVTLINNNPRQYASMISGKTLTKIRRNNKYNYLNIWINDIVKPLNDKIYKIKTKCYWILNNIQSFNDNRVCCALCNKQFKNINIKNLTNGYSSRNNKYVYCSYRCAANSKLTRQKSKETCKNKYNVNFSFQSENNKLKTKKYMQEVYNTDYYVQSQEFKEKSYKTKEEKHYYKYWNNREKFYTTCLNRYGVNHPMKNTEIQKRAEETYFQKTGFRHPAQNPEINKKLHPLYLYCNILFRSLPELAYFIWLVDNNYQFKYQPNDKTIKYLDIKNKQYIYHPDFYIISDKYGNIINELHEIKGNNQFENYDPTRKMINISNPKLNYIAEAKQQCMILNNVKIITTKMYKVYEQYVRNKYGFNYLDKFKINYI